MDLTHPEQLLQRGEIDFVSLFLQAGPVVKAAMIVLIAASGVCWAIILEKSLSLWWSTRSDRAFLQAFRANDLLARRRGEAAALLSTMVAEQAKSSSRSNLREQMTGRISLHLADVMRARESGLSILASVASTAPFVGLFGTVWGIMNSFAAIADSKNTSLAVVAPGIAEALLATAMGLLAAIPAAVFYNRLSLSATRSVQVLEALGQEALIRLARDEPLQVGNP